MQYMVRTRRRLKNSTTRDLEQAARRAVEQVKPTEPSAECRGEIVEYVGPLP